MTQNNQYPWQVEGANYDPVNNGCGRQQGDTYVPQPLVRINYPRGR